MNEEYTKKAVEEELLKLIREFYHFESMTNNHSVWKFRNPYGRDFLSLNEFMRWLESRKNI